MKKVVFFLAGTILGGAETQLLTLCRGLNQRSYELTVITNEANLSGVFWQELSSVAQIEVCQTVGDIAHILTVIQPDLVHHFHNPWMSPAMDNAGFNGPAVEVIHGCVHFPNDTTRTPKHHTSHVVGVSEDALKFFLTGAPGWKEKSSVVLNGIDIERFKPSPEPQPSTTTRPVRILHVGRLCEGDKQYTKMIDACMRLPTQDWTLWIVGTGVDFEMIRDYAEYNVPGKVKFFGYTPEPEKIYRQADIYLSRSPTEGFGLSIAEAAASGLALCVWDCGGIVQNLTHGKDALISKTEKLFESTLSFLVKNPVYRKRLGQSARTTAVAHFSESTMIESYDRLYTKLIKEKPVTKTRSPFRSATRVHGKRIVGVSNPGFTGVTQATKAWVGADNWVASPPRKTRQEVDEDLRRILAFRPEIVILGGSCDHYETLVKGIRERSNAKVLLSWHGTFSFNSFAPKDGAILSRWVQLLRAGHIDRIGFVKPNQHLALHHPGAVYFPNRVPPLKRPKDVIPKTGGIHIGVFGTGYPWKNMQQMVIGAGMVKNAIIHVNHLEGLELISTLGIRVVQHMPIEHAQFIKLLASMQINVQGSFTESFGLTFCESYRVGVPCATTPGVQVLPGNVHTQMPDPDDVLCVKGTIEHLLQYPKIEETNRELDQLDEGNERQINLVLKEILNEQSAFEALALKQHASVERTGQPRQISQPLRP